MSAVTEWVARTFLDTVQEAAPAAQYAPATAPRRGFETAIPVGGLTETNAATGGMGGGDDRASIMTELYDAYLKCTPASTAANAIARTITGGGVSFKWDNQDGEGDVDTPDKPLQVQQCERLLRFTNAREDIIQLLRSTISDLLVFGDAFIEIAWAAGVPVALYTLDSPTTTPLADPHGEITGYVQITEQGQRANFKPHEIIHISLDAPRSGLFGVSPMFLSQIPIMIWLYTAGTLKELFRKGLPANIHVDHPGGMTEPQQKRWLDQYMTRNVGPANIGRPVMTKGNGTVKELQSNRIDEILHVLDLCRDLILSTFGVPPAEAGVIESGNIGGGTGESQRKMFEINTCGPIAALILEKLNYVLLRAFGIDGWSLDFNSVDMRDSETIEKIRDMRIRNGLWTLDKGRADIGEPPVDGGNQAILVDRTGVILWRDMEASSTSTIAKTLQGTDLEPDSYTHGEVLTLKKAEPKPVPPALQAFAGGAAPPKLGDPPAVEDPEKPAEPAAEKPVPESTPRGYRRPQRETWAAYSARMKLAMREGMADDDADRAA